VEILEQGLVSGSLVYASLRAWVLMVNHVHISIYPEARLSRITKAIKNHSARQANAIFAHHWAHRLAVLARVRGPEELAKIVRYIEKNPVVAGWRAEGHVHLR
jgi:REP element-mobilizing transposase RayT